jgi:poly(ADP-ribose) glycohydrolase ARH3
MIQRISIDQFQGVIMGLAVGDAVGSAWEGMPAEMIFAMGPADKIVQHATREAIHYTDDTQMTIGVAQELVERKAMDKYSLAKRFAENYHPDRGYGQGARRIINAIGFGEDWEYMARTIFNGEGSLGNGAAMRVAPIGLFFSPDFDEIVAQAEMSASPTHCHEIGVDGARLIAAATALAALSSGSEFDRTLFLRQLMPFAKTEEFQWQIEQSLQLSPFQSLMAFGNSLEAHRSVMTSILCFADSPNDYAATIARAIGQGNDVDTLAAMAGALSGARLGLTGIPENLLECLEDNFQGKTFLLELAEKLWNAHESRASGL